MRAFYSRSLLVIALLAAPLHAQDKEKDKDKPKFLVKVESTRIGFRPYNVNDSGQFKIGMWTPVFVDVMAGLKGMPIRNAEEDKLTFQALDSEGVGTFYHEPLTPLGPLETQTFIGYAKPGSLNFNTAKIEVSLNWDGKTFTASNQTGNALQTFGGHLYLTLGARMPEVREAIVSLFRGGGQFNPDDLAVSNTGPRSLVYETEVKKLPTLWFGYQAMDLIILNTDKRQFLADLTNDVPRLSALAKWVRRGGRLIIPVNYQTQDQLNALLTKAQAWTLPIPVVPSDKSGDVKANAIKNLHAVTDFAQAQGKPFPGPGKEPVPLANLSPDVPVLAGMWDVRLQQDGRPLITRVPYGLGSITYVAFSFDQGPFAKWDGRIDFLKQMIERFAAPLDRNMVNNFDFKGGPGWDGGGQGFDLTTDLQRTLDNFDVNVVPFGYVALFIILYILVVGPLDYFVLKYVFNKLEWTWVTFPAVVLGVSIAAYFTAYALKGNDLKINKVDVIDFDLRTGVDSNLQLQRAHAYGQSFFTVLSPRIQNYTVGVEPNPSFWDAREKEPLSADLVSWMGRPEFDGPGGMGANRSQGFFRRPYTYAEEARGLEAVPIPMWTTKSFTASWETPLAKAPFDIDLAFHTTLVDGRDVKLSGTVKNNLAVDLESVWIFFNNNAYHVKDGLPRAKAGAEVVKLTLERADETGLMNWSNSQVGEQQGPRDPKFQSAQGNYNPTGLVKQALFYEKINQGNAGRNYSLRGLDQGWRIGFVQEDEFRKRQVMEGVLYARVKFVRGEAEAVTADAAQPLPANLWLGRLPQAGEARPGLQGQMAQDTYVRVLFPIKAAAK